MRTLHFLNAALAVALVQEADECTTALGPQESLHNTNDGAVIRAESDIELPSSFLNETLEFAPAQGVIKAGLISKWKGKMTIGKKLGAGAFGTAFIATLNKPCPAENVVIKIQNAQGSKKSWMDEIIKPELSAMKTLSSVEGKEYFVGLLGAGEGPNVANQFSMLLELANKGTLTSSMFKGGASVALPEKTVGHMLHQMLTGLKVLAAQDIVHRDLKPDNILVVEEGGQLHAKIADFGLACPKKGGSWSHCGLAGTPIYMAPEMFMRPSVVAPSNDVWAVGVMAYQFINPGAVMLPFIRGRGWKPQDLARAPGPESYVHGSGPLVPFVKGLLQPKKENRWTVTQGLKYLEDHGFTSTAPPGYALPPCFEQMIAEPEPEPAPKPAVQPVKPKPIAKPKPTTKPMPRKPVAVKVQIPKDASAGELVTFIHKGREVDAAMPANAKAGDEVEIHVDEDEDHVDQVVLHAGADQMQATALTKILEGKNLKGNSMAQYLPKKLQNLDWTIVDIGGMPRELFLGSDEDAIANREKLQNGDFGRVIILHVKFSM